MKNPIRYQKFDRKKIARKHNLNHEICRINEKYISTNIASIADIFEEPMGMLEPHYPIAQISQRKRTSRFCLMA